MFFIFFLISNAPFQASPTIINSSRHNRELEQELKAYKRSSESANVSVDSDSPKLVSGYLGQQQHRPSSIIGVGGMQTTPPLSSEVDGGKGDGNDVFKM
jgi:hypothetical protein